MTLSEVLFYRFLFTKQDNHVVKEPPIDSRMSNLVNKYGDLTAIAWFRISKTLE